MNHYYFKVSKAGFDETMQCAFELINQGYDQQDPAVKDKNSEDVQLYIDKSKMQFFMVDPDNMDRCEELAMDLHNAELIETNLNHIESWQTKKARA